jgi:hypothetical protein
MNIHDNKDIKTSKDIPNLIICPKCGFEQKGNTECLKCGIVYSKFSAIQRSSDHPSDKLNDLVSDGDIDGCINRTGKIAVLALMSFFFFYMVIKRSSWCFLDHVNLPFHEFGHILFGPFGETFHFLGGTLSQLMWPFILVIYFIMRKEWLSSSFCLFWFGENFLNISKYVADARSMSLPLVGGGIHDWNFLLGKWGALKYDHTIAMILFVIGVLVMTASIGWALFAKQKTDTAQGTPFQ